MPALTRRTFVAASSAALVVPMVKVREATAMLQTIEGGLPASYPSHDPDLVREVVGKAHVNYDRVRELVTPRPALAKAVWDWGFGDWESALGAASHMGRPDIAQLLIEHGARPNLFTFAMLGQVDVVRATCDANPGIQRQPGP
ncbi:MAG: ankyrin repeat domain-containing protein, partial [Vicinamibacterales bacterium]